MEKHLIENNSVPIIYVYHTSFLGDILIAFYFLEALKKINPDSKIIFITTPLCASIAKNLDCIDQVIEFDKRSKNVDELTRTLIDSIEYNSIFINLHPSARSYLIALKVKSRFKIVYKNSILSFLFKRKVRYKAHVHERYRLFEFLKYFNNANIVEDLPNLDLPEASEKYDNYIMFFPGSVWDTKKWGRDSFVELADYLKEDYKILIAGSKNENELCEYIANRSDTLNIAGKYDLLEILSLVKDAKLIVCNDSSPTHMANLFKTNVVTIFGPTSPKFGFYPLHGSFVENLKLDCRPCNIHGPMECPLGTHECMKSITSERVLEEINLLLAS